MKSILFLFAFIPALAFSQTKTDPVKTKTFELYKKSNVRKTLGYKLSDFDQVYKWKELSRESLILNSLNRKDLKELISYIKCTETIDKRTNTPLVIEGNDITQESIKEYKNHFNPNCKPTN